MKNIDFNLYCLFTASWFLHIAARLPILGALHVDFLLACVLFARLVFKLGQSIGTSPVERTLRLLIAYAILTIPFVEWPGTALHSGIESLVKAVAFFYFTVAFVTTEARLRRFLLVFAGCQLVRVLEPLYLHVTQGYWGSFAAMANWEYMDRLAGAPADVVNPNGLAFVICTLIPFLYFSARVAWRYRIAALVFVPACVHALLLTRSRSGFVAFIALFAVILGKSRHRIVLLAFATVATIVVTPMLGGDVLDRYLSVFGYGTKNLATAEGRFDGIESSWDVALRRPIFGHGLGTSLEANANYAGTDKPAHDLYAEIAQELGIPGVFIFVALMRSIFLAIRRHSAAEIAYLARSPFLGAALDATQAWFIVNLVFSVVSYGLTSYEWYLLGGLAVVLKRLASPAAVAPIGPTTPARARWIPENRVAMPERYP